MNWTVITAVATVVSTLAFVATALFVALELRDVGRTRYLTVSSDLYGTWQSKEFMEAQLWLIHRLEETTWAAFVAQHRADYGEQAFHRVGSFYNRVGTLVRLKLIDENEILSTLGPYAIAVWGKIEPLVKEARQAENSILFNDYERMLPACYECYVPNLAPGVPLNPFSEDHTGPAAASPAAQRESAGSASRSAPPAVRSTAPAPPAMPAPPAKATPPAPPAPPRPPAAVERITPRNLHAKLKRGEPVLVLDVRKTKGADTIAGAVAMDPDSIPQRLGELPRDREIVAFCA
jgi:hypothetical protein